MDTAIALLDGLAVNFLDARDLIKTFGQIGVLCILFAETGLLIGFFLPGDSLLFLAGAAASPVAVRLVGTKLDLPVLLIAGPICAIVGAQLGHYLGARWGSKLFDRPDSRLFKKKYVEKAEYYFNKFGPARAVVFARFIPVVRTFLNPVAGVLHMPARTFFLWNVIGGILWVDGLVLVGWKVADAIPPEIVERYLIIVVAALFLIPGIPVLIEIIKGFLEWRRSKKSGVPATSDASKIDEAASPESSHTAR